MSVRRGQICGAMRSCDGVDSAVTLRGKVTRLIRGFVTTNHPSSHRRDVTRHERNCVTDTILTNRARAQMSVRAVRLRKVALQVISPLGTPALLPAVVCCCNNYFIDNKFTARSGRLHRLTCCKRYQIVTIRCQLTPRRAFPTTRSSTRQNTRVI